MMYFSILPSVIITSGLSEYLIMDIEENSYSEIPIEWGKILESSSIFIIGEEEVKYEEINIPRIYDQELVDYMVNNGMAIITRFPTTFSSYSFKEWGIPFPFESLIIDVNSIKDLHNVLSTLPSRRISHFIQLRLFFICSAEKLKKIIKDVISYGYFNIEVVFNHDKKTNISAYTHILASYPFHISRLVVMNSMDLHTLDNRIRFNKNKITNSNDCGLISENLFSINIDSYAKYCLGNTCLWKKISIDVKGNIRNCPSTSVIYGNISNTSLIDVLSNKTYHFLSNIKKEDVEDCRQCKFRKCCIDCRGGVNNYYEKPNKCNLF